MKVLVAEDSEKLRRRLAFALKKSGYTVDATENGEEALWLAHESAYDVLVLDLMLPGLDGMSVLKALRDGGVQTPVLILTVKSAVEDRVAGLRGGADDYLTKPFALEELLARVESLVRRRYAERNPVLSLGAVAIDTRARQVSREGKSIALTAREYKLFEFLALRKGEVVSRTEIEEHLYSSETEIFSNVVESTVSSLRKKLEAEGASTVVHTRRGMGYYASENES